MTFLIAATNFGGKLDKALFRRFDDLIEFSLPQDTEVWKTIQQLFAGVKTSKLCKEEVITVAKGLSYSEITRACEEAIKEMIIKGKKQVTTPMLVEALTERRLAAYH